MNKMQMGPFKLDDRNFPVKTTWEDIAEREKADRGNEVVHQNRVALSHYGKYKISTVFLSAGYDGMFESMVFFQDLGYSDLCCERYPSFVAALGGHAMVYRRVMDGEFDDAVIAQLAAQEEG